VIIKRQAGGRLGGGEGEDVGGGGGGIGRRRRGGRCLGSNCLKSSGAKTTPASHTHKLTAPFGHTPSTNSGVDDNTIHQQLDGVHAVCQISVNLVSR
jgi:hypothetical protein